MASQQKDNSSKFWCKNSPKLIKCRFKWEIGFFSLRNENMLKSTTFSPPDDTEANSWQLHLYPRGKTEQNKGHISLFLRYLPALPDQKLLAKADFSLQDTLGKPCFTMNMKSSLFTSGEALGNSWGCENFALRSEVTGSLLLPNDKLTVCCSVSYLSNASRETSGMGSIPTGEEEASPVPASLLSKNLLSLYKDGLFCDVTIRVRGNEEFCVHKNILAAQSPVLKAMFLHPNTKESNQGIIDIMDYKPRVVEEMINYIYTDRVPNLASMAEDLLAISEKYLLARLKSMAEYELSSKLTVENAADLLILSETYSATFLKNKATEFTVANIAAIVKTAGWISLLQSYPHIVERMTPEKRPRSNSKLPVPEAKKAKK